MARDAQQSELSRLQKLARRDPAAAAAQAVEALLAVGEAPGPACASYVEFASADETALTRLGTELLGPRPWPATLETRLTALAGCGAPLRLRAALSEALLLSAGRSDEALQRHAHDAHRAATHVATYRAVARRYPMMSADAVLAALVAATPDEPGKWFAAAKEAQLYDRALELARASPCDPKTLLRAARDHLDDRPSFALDCCYVALHWIGRARTRDVSRVDVWEAYERALELGARLAELPSVEAQLRALVTEEPSPDRNLLRVLGRELGLR